MPVYSETSLTLPGAPSAFADSQGFAVFKDDLPPLKGFTGEQTTAWHNYMRTYFREDLFVSLPYTLNSSANEKQVFAICNVNVKPIKPDAWRRAYHLEWLCEARDQVKSSLCQAYEAFQLMCDCDTLIHGYGGGAGITLNPLFPSPFTLQGTQPLQLSSGNN